MSLTALVVGGGPAGLAAACLLAREGVSTTLIADDAVADPRTVALMQPTLAMLEYLGVWPGDLRAISAPLKKQRIVDDTGSLFSGPDICFDARELGLEAFAWNIPLAKLIEALHREAGQCGVHIVADRVVDTDTATDRINVTTRQSGQFHAQVALAADGHGSLMRQKAGIGTHAWSYDQSALVTSFTHTAHHQFSSCEYTKRDGPCTVVPLPGKQSALVWMDRPAETERRLALDDTSLATELQIATHGELGLISGLMTRKAFPMRGLTATSFGKGRTLLIGEAAHVVPPIGAQGLNMSFRDAALAVDIILGDKDAGSEKVVDAFSRQRMQEVVPRQQMINAVNRSLLLGLLPLDATRVAALWAVYGLQPLRQQMLRIGLGTESTLPFAMRAKSSPAVSVQP